MTDRAPEPKPKWHVPAQYGYAGAVQSAGSVAAPLLAGFALTVIAQLLTQSPDVRWIDASIALLALAVVLFVVAVQFAFLARVQQVTPAEIEMWWGDETEARLAQLQDEQREHFDSHRRMATCFRRFFNAGLLGLFAGLAVAVVPHGSIGVWRGLAVGVFGLAALMEVWLITRNSSVALDPPSNPFSWRRDARRTDEPVE